MRYFRQAFSASCERKVFPPTYSYGEPGHHGLLEGFLCDHEDGARPFSPHPLYQHLLHGSWDVLVNPCLLGQEVAEPFLHRSYGFQERLVGHEPEMLTLAPEAAALLRVVSKLELHPRVKITPQLTKALSYPWSLKKRCPSGIFSQYQTLLSNKKKRGEKTGKEEGLAAC